MNPPSRRRSAIEREECENEKAITAYSAAHNVAFVGRGEDGKRGAGDEMAQMEVENAVV